MKLIFRAVLFCALATAARPADVKTAPMEDVIAEIMAHPDFHQMCDPADFGNKTIPLPIYGRLMGRTNGIAPAHLKVLQARRAELVPVLKSALASLHPEKPAKGDLIRKRSTVEFEKLPNGGGQYVAGSQNPGQFNALYLLMVQDLHVIEALPELLALEERLRGAIQYADEHPKSPLPDVAWDGSIWHIRDGISERDKFLEICRVDQREILGLTLRLLREQRFPPLLESTFEKRFQERVEEAAAKDKWMRETAEKEKSQLAANPDSEFLWPFDGYRPHVEMPFSGEARNEVRRLARQFLETVPPEQWKHAAP